MNHSIMLIRRPALLTLSIVIFLAGLSTLTARVEGAASDCASGIQDWFVATQACQDDIEAYSTRIQSANASISDIDVYYSQTCLGQNDAWTGSTWSDASAVCGGGKPCSTADCNTLASQRVANVTVWCTNFGDFGTTLGGCAYAKGGHDCYLKLVDQCNAFDPTAFISVYNLTQQSIQLGCSGLSSCSVIFPPPTASPTNSPVVPSAPSNSPSSGSTPQASAFAAGVVLSLTLFGFHQ